MRVFAFDNIGGVSRYQQVSVIEGMITIIKTLLYVL